MSQILAVYQTSPGKIGNILHMAILLKTSLQMLLNFKVNKSYLPIIMMPTSCTISCQEDQLLVCFISGTKPLWTGMPKSNQHQKPQHMGLSFSLVAHVLSKPLIIGIISATLVRTYMKSVLPGVIMKAWLIVPQFQSQGYINGITYYPITMSATSS